jgi:outer membrane lipoprotein-sorting protein
VSIAACVAAVVLTVSGAAPSAQSRSSSIDSSSADSFDELYRRGYQTGTAVRTLTARFTETTTSSLLVRPLVAHGTLTVQRPAQVVLRFTDPEPRTVLISGERMTVSWPARKLQQVSNVSSSQGRIQKYLASETADELRRQFDIEHRDRSDRAGTYAFVLTPKQRRVRDTITRLDLWVESSSFLLDAIRMTFASGDTKMMVFEDVVVNPSLDPAAFSLDR